MHLAACISNAASVLDRQHDAQHVVLPAQFCGRTCPHFCEGLAQAVQPQCRMAVFVVAGVLPSWCWGFVAALCIRSAKAQPAPHPGLAGKEPRARASPTTLLRHTYIAPTCTRHVGRGCELQFVLSVGSTTTFVLHSLLFQLPARCYTTACTVGRHSFRPFSPFPSFTDAAIARPGTCPAQQHVPPSAYPACAAAALMRTAGCCRAALCLPAPTQLQDSA